jgi:hypothetical protein
LPAGLIAGRAHRLESPPDGPAPDGQLCHDLAVRMRRLLLTLLAVAGTVEAIGVWLGSPPLYLPAGAAALAALTAYAALIGRDSRRLVRWPLLVALAVATIRALVQLAWYRPQRAYDQELTMILTMREYPGAAHRLLDDLWHATPTLVVFGCLAVAVCTLPARRRVVVGMVTGILALIVAALPLWSPPDESWYTLVVPLLVVALALATAVVSGQRAGGGPVAGLGLALMTVPALLVDGPARFAGLPPPSTGRHPRTASIPMPRWSRSSTWTPPRPLSGRSTWRDSPSS